MPSKTEKEKMLAGENYNLFDPELEAQRQKAKVLYRMYNLSEAGPERDSILERMLGHIGGSSNIEPPFYCSYGENITIGDSVYINFMCTFFDNNRIRIGDHVLIGPVVQIYTVAHHLQAEARIRGMETASPVT